MTRPARVLGHQAPPEPPSDASEPSNGAGSAGEHAALVCPICNEQMVTLNQLNQHIDDAHSTPEPAATPKKAERAAATASPSPRRKINIDVFGDKFSLSDGDGSNRARISRAHWKSPAPDSICHVATCRTPLNVKNGIVNCRKCGNLFCNFHTDYKVKLANGKAGPVYYKNGVWSKVCVACYYRKPDLANGTDVNFHDLTELFKSMRDKALLSAELERSRIVKKFIKLLDFLVEEQKRPKTLFASFEGVSEAEKGLVNWQDDSTAQHCFICMTKFGLFLRKHHCRVCGRVVCDDRFGERQNCALVVPLDLLLSKLPDLNYSPSVESNLPEIAKADICIRCCRECKDNLLYDYKLRLDPENEIINDYTQLLILKRSILHNLTKYKEFNTKLRDRILMSLKDFESLVFRFKQKYFEDDQVRPQHKKNTQLLNTINQSVLLFLKKNLVEFNQLNERYKAANEKQANIQKPKTPPPPTLTKRQIRELREKLMVVNEQKFLIGNLIAEATKQRKFDELEPLKRNSDELQREIDDLEQKLGEFGF